MKLHDSFPKLRIIRSLSVNFIGDDSAFSFGKSYTIFGCNNKDINRALHYSYPRVVTIRFYVESRKHGLILLDNETVVKTFI